MNVLKIGSNLGKIDNNLGLRAKLPKYESLSSMSSWLSITNWNIFLISSRSFSSIIAELTDSLCSYPQN